MVNRTGGNLPSDSTIDKSRENSLAKANMVVNRFADTDSFSFFKGGKACLHSRFGYHKDNLLWISTDSSIQKSIFISANFLFQRNFEKFFSPPFSTEGQSSKSGSKRFRYGAPPGGFLVGLQEQTVSSAGP